ncbi:hypothetical protein [Polymorphobacter megasporae]|uniref:hypothetical protein n=1 Tax=Glacieibacterium megasporae TaxID=2835787 RepID=UPI001C1DF595|nr:hypothetical protein [Polymorphobacter megasporae]UAJ10640.1 hypothetical protein KTC28_02470 [Polymorphobacter megasporae]
MSVKGDKWVILEAISTTVAAIAVVAIPIVLAYAARQQENARTEQDDKQSQATTTREVFGQFQIYNLKVASGSITRDAIRDNDFEGLNNQELKELHIIFHKMTLIYQLWIAHGTGSWADRAAETAVQQIGKTCRENPKLYRIAIRERGYGEDFLAHLERLPPPLPRLGARNSVVLTIVAIAMALFARHR